MTQRQTDRAIFAYEMAAALNPACAEALNNLGVLHRERGNLERASHCYTAALQIRPNFPQVPLPPTIAGKAVRSTKSRCSANEPPSSLQLPHGKELPVMTLMHHGAPCEVLQHRVVRGGAGAEQPGGGMHSTGPRGRCPPTAAG